MTDIKLDSRNIEHIIFREFKINDDIIKSNNDIIILDFMVVSTTQILTLLKKCCKINDDIIKSNNDIISLYFMVL